MNNLEDLRKEIENIDHSILELLQKRFNIVKDIGLLKDGSDVEDDAREQELFNMYQEWSAELGLDMDLVKGLFERIILESKRIQQDI